MFTSKRGLFSSEHGATTSWLAGITSAALLVASIALPAVAVDESATPELAAAAEEAAVVQETTVEETPAEEAVVEEAPAEEVAAEEAVIDVPVEDEVVDESAPAVAEDPAPPAEDPVSEEPAPVEEQATASSTDGDTPDNNSPPVEEFVPGIKVTTDSDSATLAFPAFGADGAYVVQSETPDGDWSTLDATVKEAPEASTRDYVAQIDGLEAGATYTVRIVTAPTEAQAEAATEDAVSGPEPGRGMSAGAIVRTQGKRGTSTTRTITFTTAAPPAAEDYTLNWSAADPKTYDQVPPSALTCPTPPGTGGRASDPIANAIYGDPKASVQSLAPADVTLGQIVPFEVKVDVSDVGADGVIEFTPYWRTETTSGGAFGYDPVYKVYCAFVDIADTATVDPDGDAKVDTWTKTVVGNEIQGTVTVSGLDGGDSVVVEIWVVLMDRLPTKATGNVQAGWVGAETAEGAEIQVGVETIPLLKVGDFYEPGSIRIVKDAVPNAAQEFTFKTKFNPADGSQSEGTFALTDDGGTNNTRLFDDLLTGLYQFQEDAIPGWDLTKLICKYADDDTSIVDADTSIVTGIAAVRLKPGENVVCTFTNERSAATVKLQKRWLNGAVDDAAALTIDGKPTDPAVVSKATGKADETDGTNFVEVSVFAGGSVDLAEVLGAGNTGSYSTGLTCSAGSLTYKAGDLTGSLVTPLTPTDVVCTFKNERTAADLTLQKLWVNGFTGDTADLSVTGSTNGAKTSTAPELPAVNQVVVPVRSGETVTLAELLGKDNKGSYTAELACTDKDGLKYTLGDLTGTYTMPKDAKAVTCTFKNERSAGTVKLQKRWLNGAVDDAAALTIDGKPTDPAVVSKATGKADETDATNFVKVDVLSGASVDLAEVLGAGNTGSYSTGLTCSAGSLTYKAGDLTGSVTMPKTPTDVVCTFKNERSAGTVKLQKRWLNGAVDDAAALTIDGKPTDPAVVSKATGKADETDGTNFVEVSVFAGGSVDLAEVLGAGNTGSYSTGLTCSAGSLTYKAGDLTGSVTMPKTPTDVVCTFKNERSAGTVKLQKRWLNGAVDDAAALTIDGKPTDPAVVSKATGKADETDATNFVKVDVLSGASVDLAEVLGAGNTGSYSTGLTCSAGSLTYKAGDLTGSVTMPKTPTDVVCTFKNERTAADLTLQKLWVNGFTGDTADLSVTGSTNGAKTSTAPELPAVNQVVVPVRSGETVTLAELLGKDNKGSYTAELACTDKDGLKYTLGDLTGTYTMPKDAKAVTCTFKNERSAGTVKLQKRWLNGAVDDAAALTIDGKPTDPAVVSKATGKADETDATNFVKVDVLSGASVDLAEVLGAGNTGSYSTGLTCSAGSLTYKAGDLTGSVTMPKTPTDVVCTFKNERTAADLTLQKLWVNGFTGDTADLSVTGSTNGAKTSTAPELPAVNQVVVPVRSGETVTLAELLGKDNKGSYTAELACTDKDGLKYTLGDLTGTYTMPKDAKAVTCTFKNERSAADLTLQKLWVNGFTGDTADLSVTGSTNGAKTSTAPELPAVNQVVVPVRSGETVTLAELLGKDNKGSYTAELACTDKDGLKYTLGDLTGTYTMPKDAKAVTCTFKNERSAADLTLQKLWVNGFTGDTADLSVTGSTNGAKTSTAPELPAVNQVVVPVRSGETVTLAELLGKDNKGSYTAELACTDKDGLKYTLGDLTGTYTMPKDAKAVTCTYTNTRTSNDVVLQKEWVNSAVGDTADLKIIGGLEDPAEATSTSDGGSYLDDEDTASTLVYSGETVTVSEILGEDNLGTYTSALLCTTAGEEGPEEFNITGTFTMPNTAVTCTYTNTRTSNDVVLQKEWVNSAVGDTADLKIIGGLEDPAEATSTSDGGSYLDDEDTASTLVYSGETVTVSEILGEDNLGTYTSALLCTTAGEEGPEEFNITGTFTMPNTTVTCTYTNTRTKGDLVIKKVVVGDVAGASTDFMVDVVCSPGSGFNYSRVPLTQANEWTATLTGIHSGLSCVVTEASVPAGWVLTTISPSPAVIGGEPVTVTVTNTRTVGDLVIKKVVVGPIEGVSTDFTVNVDCTPGTAYDKTGVVLNQANNWTITYTGIPTGVSCVVTEPVVPAGWTLTSIAPSPAVIGSSPVTVTVTNTRNGIPGLDKTSAIEDGGPTVEPGDVIDYTVTVSNTGGLPISGPVVDTLPAGLTVVAGTVSGGGTPNTELTQITWQVTLAPGETQTFTYKAIVGDGVETGDSLVNLVTFQGLQDSTATPVELPPVAPIEEEVVGGTEDLAKTGADYIAPLVTAALLALLAGGLMVVFGRRRRYNA